jgi:cysteine synthase B
MEADRGLVEGEATPHATAAAVLAAVGNTPLVELDFGDELPAGVRIFAKLESVNPGSSIKDRPVLRMIRRAIDRGTFRGGRRLLDSSSGNAGIAYAQFGALLGVGVTLVVPANASRERLQRIAAHGAELVLTDPHEGYDFAVHTARRLAAEHPDRYWYCNQYANDDNWRAHYDTTGREILEQLREVTGTAPDAFVAGVGTGGTLTGVGRRLREHHPGVHVTSVVPEIFPGIEGLKPLGHPGDLVPQILDESLIDHRVDVTIDQAVAGSRRLARQGLFVGPSSGAYVHAALEVAAGGRFKTVVTLLNDAGERYGSTPLWELPEGASAGSPSGRSPLLHLLS